MPKPKKSTRGGGGGNPSSSGLDYRHSEKALLRPEAGSQQSFSKQKSPQSYRYDSSLAPELSWDENETRSEAERLIASIAESDSLEAAKSAANKLKRLGDPFLEWTGKAERNEFTVPTLPLFVHERLSTKAILNTLEKHKRDRNLTLDLFNEGSKTITDAIKGAYEHKNGWQNRLILGDSLQVMNSLLQYENMGRQVQMVYMDPPYGIKYGSNFQPFVRQRKVVDGEDGSISREPETVQAFRDTWELGIHSWLTYMRDRLLLARELLTDSGSCFVQISDENVHYVRNVMDEVFGRENFVSLITYRTTGGLGSNSLTNVADYIVWYSKSKEYKYRSLFKKKDWGLNTPFKYLIFPNGEYRTITEEENANPGMIPKESKVCSSGSLVSSGYTQNCTYDFEFNGKKIKARSNSWKTNKEGMYELIRKNRVALFGSTPRYVYLYDDFQFSKLDNVWKDLIGASNPIYAVQTNHIAIERCMLMTTDPGDIVLDPTCGSGTTPFTAEKWGRRWIAMDLSRVPLSLARERLLTEVYPYYQLAGNSPSEGFVYRRKTNSRGKEIGGIVPHVSLKTVANNEPPKEEVLIDKPHKESGMYRVSGPFCIEAIMPPPVSPSEIGDIDNPEEISPSLQDQAEHIPRMIEILRLSPKIRMANNEFLELREVFSAGKSPNLHAEAQTSDEKRTAVVFGPANGAIGERIVLEAAREAGLNDYDLLLVIAFAIEPSARQAIEHCKDLINVKALYVQASTDLVMSDLLKNLRSSHTFAVCGLPEVELKKTDNNDDGEQLYQVSLLGLDSFDPASMEQNRLGGNDVPCWMLDPDYDGQCFRAGQVFFPRTGAWDKLKKSISAEFDESALEHLKGTTSAPFLTGEQEQIAVKAIDMRGNELLVVKKTSEAV